MRRFEKRLNRLVADFNGAEDADGELHALAFALFAAPTGLPPETRMPRLWPNGGLWRHRDFLKLWSAETISQFGCAVDDLAIGFVAIVVLDASAFEVALLGTLKFLPFILFTLPAGVWVDRLRRRPILIAGDFGRAALLATIPIAYVADALTIWQLYTVVFLTGICTVFFDVAYQSYLPSLVERDQIIDGNSKLEISRSAAQMGGPGLAGALVEILTAPYAVLVDAISFLGSGLFLLGIRKPEEAPVRATVDGRKTSLWTELKEGLALRPRQSATCARRRDAPQPPTSSPASRSRSSSSSWCASSASPRA